MSIAEVQDHARRHLIAGPEREAGAVRAVADVHLRAQNGETGSVRKAEFTALDCRRSRVRICAGQEERAANTECSRVCARQSVALRLGQSRSRGGFANNAAKCKRIARSDADARIRPECDVASNRASGAAAAHQCAGIERAAHAGSELDERLAATIERECLAGGDVRDVEEAASVHRRGACRRAQARGIADDELAVVHRDIASEGVRAAEGLVAEACLDEADLVRRAILDDAAEVVAGISRANGEGRVGSAVIRDNRVAHCRCADERVNGQVFAVQVERAAARGSGRADERQITFVEAGR